MTQIAIDTNVYSFLCHGRMDVARLLAGYDVVIVPSVVLGELEAGFREGSRYEINKTGLRRFLALDRVRTADADAAVAECYGRIHAELKSEGQMIPLNDVWIAATAMSRQIPIASFDSHFKKVSGINLIFLDVDI